MHEPTTLHHTVMRRVRRIHLLRRFITAFLLRVYALTFVALSTAFFVSVPNVIANMPGDLSSLGRFLAESFLHTEVVVQVLSLGLVLLGILVIRDFFRLVGQGAVFPRS